MEKIEATIYVILLVALIWYALSDGMEGRY